MLRVIEFAPDGAAHDRAAEDLTELRKADGPFWVEMQTPSDEEFDSVRRAFEWHPLAIEDMQVDSHLPKIDDYDDHLLLVVHAVALDDRGRFDTAEIEVFLGSKYLVTHHREPAPVIGSLLERCQRNPALAGRGAAYLLY